MNKLNFSINDAYKKIELDYYGAKWIFNSNLSVEDVFKIQNDLEISHISHEKENRSLVIEKNINNLEDYGTRRLTFQKRAVDFIFSKIREDAITLINQIEDSNNFMIDNEFLKKVSYQEFPFFFNLATELAVNLVGWLNKQGEELKKK